MERWKIIFYSIAILATATCTLKSQGPTAPDFGIHRSLYIYPHKIYCAPPATNCFDDVKVRPGQFMQLDRLEAAITNHTTVGYFRGADWITVLPFLGNYPKKLELLRGGLPLLRFETDEPGVTQYIATRLSRAELLAQASDGPVVANGVEFCMTVRRIGTDEHLK